MSAEDEIDALARFSGQHPAAIRAVRWQSEPLAAHEFGHLEIETKHGQVVVIDHIDGSVYSNPPRPPVFSGTRQQRDLTDELPSAFNDRPVILHLRPIRRSGMLSGWRCSLSSGAAVILTLDPNRPQVTAEFN